MKASPYPTIRSTCMLHLPILWLALVGALVPTTATSDSSESISRPDDAGSAEQQVLVTSTTGDGLSNPTPESIWERSLAVQRIPAVRGEAVLHIATSSGFETNLEVRFVERIEADGWSRAMMTRIESGGALRGSSFLSVERGNTAPIQWIYLPAVQSPRRIPGAITQSSYFGSDFTYSDFLQPWIDEFDVRLLGADAIDGVPCWKIESMPINVESAQAVHGRRVMWIRQDNFVERRIEYLSRAGQLVRVQDIEDVMPAGRSGRWMALKRRMRNVRSGGVSVIVYRNVETDVDVNGTQFAPQELAAAHW